MPRTFSDFQQSVAERIQDGAAKLASAAIDGCIREALTGRYSQARPLQQIADLTGDGTTIQWEINSTNLPGWVPNFSVVTQIEFPAGQRDPSILEKDDWWIYRQSSSSVLIRLAALVPAPGQLVRVSYAVPHSEAGTDVPDADFYGVVNLAASLAASRLHALYNQLGDASVGADAVDYRNKAAQYRILGQDLEKAFEVAFGMDQNQPQPAAGSVTEWRTDEEAGGRRLLH
jgi:hypothetical protein